MLKHVVMWKLNEDKKNENMCLMKEKLEMLVGVVSVIRSLQVGFNENGGEYDVILITDFDSMEDLQAYDSHPEHQKVREFIKNVVQKRAAVDYNY